MNILLLGNGFDIYHKLPTKYHNFLNVVNFLIKNKNTEINTIGDVFSNKELQKCDGFILKCYKQHESAYKTIKLEDSDIKEIVMLCENNFWFKYLLKSFNKDIGWIDFEKEIAFVLKCFNRFLRNCGTTFEPYTQLKDKDYIYVIKEFDFFFDEIKRNPPSSGYYYTVKEEFKLESPLGSENVIIDKKKIIGGMAKGLLDLAKALQKYLKCFVDSSFESIKAETSYEKCKAISNIDYAVTFNYTNTYEQLYLEHKTTHIHGNVNENIILGVNPDESDELEKIDTLLIDFKKYFQRVLLETDDEFWEFLRSMREEQHEVVLIVMGHSLDITDEDIITELFSDADEIYILYHDKKAKASYIANLVRIFGKADFDDIRQSKTLKFLPLSMDFTEFADDLAEKAFARIIEDINQSYNI